MQKIVALVACTKQKLDVPAPAQDIYTGDLFKKSRAWAELHADAWHILSAKHGLLDPGTVIEPYDMTVGDNLAGPSSLAGAQRVLDILAERYAAGPPVQFVFLAGQAYTSTLAWLIDGAFGVPWATTVDPLAGMGIGHRKQWLKSQLAA